MAAPLSGIGKHAAPPISQAFQPGGSDQTREVRQANQEARENEIQAIEAPLAQSQGTGTSGATNLERGSVVDLLI
ncbi:MAG: hypothetical protein COA45_00555 [Zetaproteobacteria bacterium]|nr:MAG: hypothetical protein COA45_00555 [Zetaproteobacteria bacterium]